MTAMRAHIAPLLLALSCIGAILFWYHDQYWWPVDDGIYAYVAQRAIAGDILHRDLLDLHAGYGNLLNIWAFRLFGEDLLSLRYPLVAITFMQCVIVYLLLAPKGGTIALVGAVTTAAFSFVLFPNPSANWHALGTLFLLCLLLAVSSQGSWSRLFLAGGLLGLCFFTRQLSGVFLSLGLICVLLLENDEDEAGGRLPGLLVGLIASAGLMIYISTKQQVFAFVWAGIWPLALLIMATLRSRMTWMAALRTIWLVAAGFLVSGLPLVLHYWHQGALSHWLSDLLFTALTIHGQEFINFASFVNILGLAWLNITQSGDATTMLSGLAWILIVGSVPALGVLGLWHFNKHKSLPAPVVLAMFWAVSALHYQIPNYLYFTLPAVFFGLLLLRPVISTSVVLVALSAYALVFQAGQPVERGLYGIVAGHRAPANEPANLPRVSLRLQAADADIYREVLDVIETTARPDETLMTLPMDPELNFMTARKSPVHYYGTPMGLRKPEDVTETVQKLDEAAPLFVVYRREDKYLTPLTAKLLSEVVARSDPPLSVGPFDLYRYRGAAQPDTLSLAER